MTGPLRCGTHGDRLEWGCHVCRVTARLTGRPAPDPGVQVWQCPINGRWRWSVRDVRGLPVETGECPTEAEAWAEAGDAAGGLAAPADPADRCRLNVSADGIGDHLMAARVAAGWLAAHPGRSLVLVAKPWCAPWLELFAGYGDLATEPDPRLPDCWPAGSARGTLHFVEAAARAPWHAPLTPRPLPPEAGAWAAPYRGCVVLSPFSLGSGTGRDWLPSHWRALEAELRAEGRRVVAIGAGGDAPRLARFAEPLAGLPPARVAALMRAAAVVVSNESGMGHLAGALNIPAVVLAAQLDGRRIHGGWPNTTVIQGPLACSGCHWAGIDFRPACNQVCASLQAITPEAVLSACRTYLDCEWFPDPELRGHLGKLLIPSPPGHRGPQPDRRGTVGAFLKSLERSADPVVVEAGCQRQARDYGAGMSTTIFGLFLRTHGGRLTSLDLSAANAATARREAAGLPVGVIETDSVAWLRRYDGPTIHGLYLDSLDTYEPGHAEHCLAEAEAALPHLHPAAPVLIDDTWPDGGGWAGKGRLAVPWLLGRGFRVSVAHYQVLLARE
jgi:hypothetical protein